MARRKFALHFVQISMDTAQIISNFVILRFVCEQLSEWEEKLERSGAPVAGLVLITVGRLVGVCSRCAYTGKWGQ